MADGLAGEAGPARRHQEGKSNINVYTHTDILIMKFPHMILDSFLNPEDTIAPYVSSYKHLLLYISGTF